MASSGLAYPDRFYAAAAYVGLGGGGSESDVISRFSSDVALLLYALYQQATAGPCNTPKPRSWSPVEQSKWASWQKLGNMPSAEAMRLFVKILEEEVPSWYTKVPGYTTAPVVDVPMHKPKEEPVFEAGTSNHTFSEPKIITAENGTPRETALQDKDVIMEGLSSVTVYDQWTPLSVSGQNPKSRYQHGAAVVQDKMYIFGGNHNGRYLSDLQVLDLKSLTWSKVDAKLQQTGSSESATRIAPCAGHSLISWQNKILSIAGHTKDPSETLSVKEFDTQTGIWSNLRTYGAPPISRGGQSVTVVGSTLVIFGGEDAKRSLLNDLHILDLESMTWDDIDTIGMPPSPRSDHVAACHAGRYLLVFGGGSHATCFNDLHVLDMQTMEWSRPKQQGITPGPRAGHAGVTVGESWFIVGGGNNQTGVSETMVLNMSTLVWSVVTSVQGRVPLASEGLSLVVSTYNGEDYLVSFGGYNGKYSNEVYVLKPSNKSGAQPNLIEGEEVSDSTIAVNPTRNNSRDLDPEVVEVPLDNKIKEISMDNTNNNGRNEEIVAKLKAEKEETEAALNREQIENLRLKQELGEAEGRNSELTKELQSVRGQLAAEQSRCFKLEVDVAELRQKLQALEALEKEVELLQRQKAATEQAEIESKQRQGSGGMWGWLVGTPPDRSDSS